MSASISPSHPRPVGRVGQPAPQPVSARLAASTLRQRPLAKPVTLAAWLADCLEALAESCKRQALRLDPGRTAPARPRPTAPARGAVPARSGGTGLRTSARSPKGHDLAIDSPDSFWPVFLETDPASERIADDLENQEPPLSFAEPPPAPRSPSPVDHFPAYWPDGFATDLPGD